MFTIQNATITVTCDESGRDLALIDQKRGTRWQLDPLSLGFQTRFEGPWGGAEADLLPLVPSAARAAGLGSLLVSYRAGEAVLEVQYRLQDAYLEVRLPVPTSGLVGLVTLPGSFVPEGERFQLLLPIMQCMLWDGRGPAFRALRGEGSHLGFSMPWIGCTVQCGGLLVIAETQDDCRWWFGKDDAGRVWATNAQVSSVGDMRYERAVRVYVTEPDLVAVAKQYQRYVIEQGRFKNWDEKIAERPAVERLFGSLMCYIGYCQDDVDYLAGCQKLKAYGFQRSFLYPGRFNMYYPDIRMGGVPAIDLPRQTIEAIKALGYDMAPWSWIMEALDDDTQRIQHQYRRDRLGQVIPNWAIDDQQWYLVCHSFMEAYQKQAIRDSIPEMTWDHFDVLSCLPPAECYALDHPGHLGRPSTRGEDRDFIHRTFQADQAVGRLVSSESFNDAYAADLDFGSVKAWPQYGPWPFWPVPLTMLVYHDSMIHAWYELHSYNNLWRGRTSSAGGLLEYGGGRPYLMAALDALMGCPPDVFPFGAQYGYSGRGKETFLYKYRFEDPAVQIALKAVLPVARLHQRIGKLEMVHFKILSEDGYVQESAFADGTHVVANFSRDFAGSEPGVDHVVVPGLASVPGIMPVRPEGWWVSP